jgi:flagellar biosynthesis protein
VYFDPNGEEAAALTHPSARSRAGAGGPRIAVALEYEPGQPGAPSVVASGRGEAADRICRVAEENGVPVRTDSALARLLEGVAHGAPIPPEAFAAVAEILAYLWRLDGTLADRQPPAAGPLCEDRR